MTEYELRKALEPTMLELRRIADLLETAMAHPPEPEPEPMCPHPESSRLQLGAGPGWMCQDCEHREP